MKHTIDAKDQKIGRVASKVASLLMGKNLSSFVRNGFPEDVKVEIINASKCLVDPKQFKDKTFARYSGFPGGLVQQKMSNVVEKKGYSELFRMAVYGMIPGNRLRPKMMKNLVITE